VCQSGSRGRRTGGVVGQGIAEKSGAKKKRNTKRQGTKIDEYDGIPPANGIGVAHRAGRRRIPRVGAASEWRHVTLMSWLSSD
jgi:hypothetical protein